MNPIIASFLLSPGGWAALAACITAAVAVVAAGIALSQLSEARRLRREQSQPYVVVFLGAIEGDPQHMDLVIKNTGSTAATDVRATFSQPLDSGALAPEHSPIKVPDRIPVLVPGQEWRSFWDFLPARTDAGLALENVATVCFKDWRGKDSFGPYTFEIDWQAEIDRGFVIRRGMHELVREIEQIRQMLHRKL